MKNKFIIPAFLSASLLFTSCADKANDKNTEVSENTIAVTETSDNTENSEKTGFFETTEDYFSKLDDDSKTQINIITSKLPELLGDYSNIYLTDLDNNGRTELVLSDPGFAVYEISEDRKSLVNTVSKTEDYPSMYPVTDKLMCTDSENRRHYIWKSLKDISTSAVCESEKEYIYENGSLTEKTLRSRIFDKYQSVYTSYRNSEGAEDYIGYSQAVSNLMLRSGLTLSQCSIGILTAEDIRDVDAENLKQLLSELKGFFSISAPSSEFMYDDMAGIWVIKSGFSADGDFFQESNSTPVTITITSDSYQLSGSVETDPSPLTFCLGGTVNTSLWYTELSENSFIKSATLKFKSDGTLQLEGTAVNKNGHTVNIEWNLQRYDPNQPEQTQTKPVTSESDIPEETQTVPENDSQQELY